MTMPEPLGVDRESSQEEERNRNDLDGVADSPAPIRLLGKKGTKSNKSSHERQSKEEHNTQDVEVRLEPVAEQSFGLSRMEERPHNTLIDGMTGTTPGEPTNDEDVERHPEPPIRFQALGSPLAAGSTRASVFSSHEDFLLSLDARLRRVERVCALFADAMLPGGEVGEAAVRLEYETLLRHQQTEVSEIRADLSTELTSKRHHQSPRHPAAVGKKATTASGTSRVVREQSDVSTASAKKKRGDDDVKMMEQKQQQHNRRKSGDEGSIVKRKQQTRSKSPNLSATLRQHPHQSDGPTTAPYTPTQKAVAVRDAVRRASSGRRSLTPPAKKNLFATSPPASTKSRRQRKEEKEPEVVAVADVSFEDPSLPRNPTTLGYAVSWHHAGNNTDLEALPPPSSSSPPPPPEFRLVNKSVDSITDSQVRERKYRQQKKVRNSEDEKDFFNLQKELAMKRSLPFLEHRTSSSVVGKASRHNISVASTIDDVASVATTESFQALNDSKVPYHLSRGKAGGVYYDGETTTASEAQPVRDPEEPISAERRKQATTQSPVADQPPIDLPDGYEFTAVNEIPSSHGGKMPAEQDFPEPDQSNDHQVKQSASLPRKKMDLRNIGFQEREEKINPAARDGGVHYEKHSRVDKLVGKFSIEDGNGQQAQQEGGPLLPAEEQGKDDRHLSPKEPTASSPKTPVVTNDGDDDDQSSALTFSSVKHGGEETDDGGFEEEEEEEEDSDRYEQIQPNSNE